MFTTQPRDLPTSRLMHVLNRCVEASIDGEKGYAAAAADARDEKLRAVFRKYSTQRAAQVTELRLAVAKELHVLTENHGTLKGTAHRGFMGARIALEGESDALILGECERGETNALAVYDRALEEVSSLDPMPTSIRKLLVDQRAAIKLAQDDILSFDLSQRRVAREVVHSSH